MPSVELIKQIIISITEAGEIVHPSTFLSVINKEYAETTVSKVVAYLFVNDLSLVKKIVDYYCDNQSINWICPDIVLDTIECEKAISDQKRIDIFMSFITDEDERINIIVENKILAHEHGQQTNYYAQWCNKHYEDARNIFIYLKPSWNESTPSNEGFAVLTYKDLVNMLQPTSNYIINDFKGYVKMLENNELSEVEALVLQNYNELHRTISEVDGKIKSFKDSVKDEIVSELGIKSQVRGDAFRFYFDRWYSKADPYYYFYVEFKFESKDMTNIVFQRTVQTWAKDLALFEYFKSRDLQYAEQDKCWFVFDKKKFDCNKPIMSQEWKSAFMAQAKETLASYIEQTNAMFDDFQLFLQNRN